jgi:hypothetical protein
MSFIAQSYALFKINSHANASICLKKTASLANAMHHIEQGAMTQSEIRLINKQKNKSLS